LSVLIENPGILTVVLFILVIWLIFLSVQLSVIRRKYRMVNEAARRGDLASVINQCAMDISSLGAELKDTNQRQNQIRNQLKGAIQRVSIVRFDAFSDVGGKLSFAVAILNENGDGVVISTINGRQESRSYAKQVKAGESPHALSREEKEAIAKAMGGRHKFREKSAGDGYEEI